MHMHANTHTHTSIKCTWEQQRGSAQCLSYYATLFCLSGKAAPRTHTLTHTQRIIITYQHSRCKYKRVGLIMDWKRWIKEWVKRWTDEWREEASGRCFLCVCAEVCSWLREPASVSPFFLCLPTSSSIYPSLPPLCLGAQQWRETSVATR